MKAVVISKRYVGAVGAADGRYFAPRRAFAPRFHLVTRRPFPRIVLVANPQSACD
ncbi:MAG: hypothetical protein WC558_05070 [Patulibacter sp.]